MQEALRGSSMSLIALVGNPNVGKSTIFNALTGLRQHTGNWPGKTVNLAVGQYDYKGKSYELVDLPGTYSLEGASPEEEITGEFIRSRSADGILVVCDATCLERSLIIALQVVRCCPKVMIAVNLIDEANKAGITIDTDRLSVEMGVPVIGVCGKNKTGLDTVREKLRLLTEGYLPCVPVLLGENDSHISRAEELCRRVCMGEESGPTLTERLDRILLHPLCAYPCLLMLLLLIFWLTIQGANYPSQALQWGFSAMGEILWTIFGTLPLWIAQLIMDGLYEPVTRVVSVMLPPMAIFFPLFTLLEDFGYLPRVAYLLDEGFRRCGACGKQALTMSMGFGCNAVGVTGCRIIDSPRERLIGILTNALVPCNGRFPALILLMGICMGRQSSGLQAVGLTALVSLSALMTLVISHLLHRTVCKGERSVFIMELPPYRRPKVGQVLLRSFLDRCLGILGRAVVVAAPMGLLLWLLQRISVDGDSLLIYLARCMERPGAILGMGGTVLLAFILGSPANELVLPIGIMILSGGGWSAVESGNTEDLLLFNGLSQQQCICTMIFMLFHWPCTTTLMTIYKETKSIPYTALSWAIPTGVGVILCLLINMIFRL